MSDEDRLRERFRAEVDGVPVVSDLDDIAARIVRRGRGRERPLIAVAVLTLAVGGLAGFALGHIGRGASPSLTVAGAGSPSDVPGTTVAGGAPADQGPHLVIVATGPTGPSLGGPPPGSDPGVSVSSESRDALVQVWDNAFDGGNSDQAHADAIEGGSGLVDVFHEIRSGPYAAQVAGAKTVVDNIVFHSPTSATVYYHANLADGSTSGPYSGEAVLTPDGWKATHASYCKVASLAGIRCV